MKAKLLFLFFLISSIAYSQERVLQFRLNTGLWDGLSYLDKDFKNTTPNFKSYYHKPLISWLFGTSLELKIDSKWRFGLGIQENLIATRYELSYEFPSRETVSERAVTHFTLPGLSTYATYRLRTWRFSSPRQEISKWSIGLNGLVDLQLLFPPKKFSTIYTPPDILFETTEITYKKHDIGANIRLGLAFNLMKRGKDVLILEAFYAQGLREIVRTQIDYRVQSVESTAVINSRGTSFGINLGIPIRIVSWNKK